jgi:hypothetical protein
LLDRIHTLLLVERGNRHTLVRKVHPFEIQMGTEEVDRTVRTTIGFETLENGLAIVEYHGGGIHLQRCIRDNSRIDPPLSFDVVHHEHVVGENLPECKPGFVSRLLLRRQCPDDRNAVTHVVLSHLSGSGRRSPLPYW